MRRCAAFTFLLILILSIVFLNPNYARGACARWVPNGLVFPFEQDAYISDIAYDANLQKYAFIQSSQNHRYFSLWHLDGVDWKKTWEGNVTSPEGDFMFPTGLYYDPGLKSLVMMAWIWRGPEEHQAVGAYRFDSPSEWIYITQEMYAWTWMGITSPIVYDPVRKRAVMPIHRSAYGEWFLEFDGSQFHRIYYHENHYFTHGKAGYDPERKVVVFHGGNEYPGGENNATYEYDGTSFTQVVTGHSLPDVVIGGFVWQNDLEGLLGLACSKYALNNCESWVYKDQDWKVVGTQSFQAEPYAAALYSAVDELGPCLMFSSMDREGPEQIDGFSFSFSSHCRPASKP